MSTQRRMPSTRRSFFDGALAVAAGAVALACLSGCRGGDASTLWLAETPWRGAEVTPGALTGQAPMAVDIDVPRGSVRVEVDPRLLEPEVITRTRWSVDDDPDHRWTRHDPPALVRTDAVAAGGAPVGAGGDAAGLPRTLRVTVDRLEGAPVDVYTDVAVRTPRCDGVNVRTSDGAVVLIGVGGAIAVDNGRDNGPGGRIELRTNRTLVDPVALVTTEGRVSAILTPASRGRLDLSTAKGEAIFVAGDSEVRDVRTSFRDWRGVWNGGDNPIHARSGRGSVRFIVTDDPETYSVADGWTDPMDH